MMNNLETDEKKRENIGSKDDPIDHQHENKNGEIFKVTTTHTTNNYSTLPDISKLNLKKNKFDFDFIKTLGKGSFGKVKLVIEKETGRGYAAKILNKKLIIKLKKAKYVNSEKTILDSLDHPNIVKLYCTFQDEENLYFILEYCPNGDLLSQIKTAGCFQIDVARFYGAEILLTLEYLHSQGVVHRDLKPENILMGKNMHVKLSDFGSAKKIGTEPKARSGSFCGTAEFVCPELLVEKSAGIQADIWSYGCLMYQLICGKLPFKGFNEYQTFQLIIKRELVFPDSFDSIAQDLIDKLLTLNPYERPTIEEIKSHPFFSSIKWDQIQNQEPPIISQNEPFSPYDSPNITKLRSMSLSSPSMNKENATKSNNGLLSPRIINGDSVGSTPNYSSTLSQQLLNNKNSVHRERSSTQDPSLPLPASKILTNVISTSSISSGSSLTPPIAPSSTHSSGFLSPSSKPQVTPRICIKPIDLLAMDKERRKNIKDQQKDSIYNQFLLPNNEIIIVSCNVEKKTGLVSKKRQLIITDTPRLFYVDSGKMIQTGEIPVDLTLTSQCKSNKHFTVVSKGRTRHFYDLDGNASTWSDIINDLNLLNNIKFSK